MTVPSLARRSVVQHPTRNGGSLCFGIGNIMGMKILQFLAPFAVVLFLALAFVRYPITRSIGAFPIFSSVSQRPIATWDKNESSKKIRLGVSPLS